MDDGTLPSDSVILQITCSGSPRNIAHTDSRGGFSVDLSSRNNPDAFADASQSSIRGGFSDPSNPSSAMGASSTGSSTQGRGNLMGCDLSAQLAGFRSDVVHLGNQRTLDNPDIGIIVLHRIGNVEGLTISATTTMAPKDARKAFDRGYGDAKKKKWELAEREFQKAVAIYPRFAMAWFELGRVQEVQKDSAAARKSFEQALAADAKFAPPYEQLAVLDAMENKWQDVADETDRLLRMNPIDFPLSWYYNGLANFQLKKFEVAERNLRDGLKVDTTHQIPKMEHLLGIILANKRDLAGAAEHLRNYLKYSPNVSDGELVRKQLEEVERLTLAKQQK